MIKMNISYRLTQMLLIAALFFMGTTIAADQMPSAAVGKIKDIKVKKSKKHPNHAFFEVTIEETYKEDRVNVFGTTMPDFGQENIVVIGDGECNKELSGGDELSGTVSINSNLTIILDRVGLYKNTFNPKTDVDFIKSIELKDRAGSYLNPDTMYTEKDRDIFSAEITVTANTEILYQFISLDRSKTGLLILKFAIVKVDENSPETVKTTAVVDITEVDNPVASVIGVTKEKDKRIIEQLLGKNSDSFATVLYPLDYISPKTASSIIKNKISLMGSISTDEDNPALLITDRVDYVISLIQSLSLLDRPVPQVEIEVKILEVAWNNDDRIGFEWGGISNDEYSAEKGSDFFSGALKTGLASIGGASTASSLLIGKLDAEKIKILNAQMQLLAEKNKLSLLASPKIKVLNNTKAEFHSGEQIPVFRTSNLYAHDTDTDYRTLGTGKEEVIPGNYTARNITRENESSRTMSEQFIDVGVKLTVLPRITPSGEIVLELTPEVSEITGWRQNSYYPIISTRELTTTVKIADSDTVLVAGLFKEKEHVRSSGIPVLQNVPGLGKLFKSESKSKEKTEVIFLLKINTSN